MPGGNKNIKGSDNTNGFQKNPQNINKKGAPVSLKKQLVELLELDGKIKIKWDQVVDFKEGIEVVIKVPTQILLMQKLLSHAMSSGNTSIKAIEMLLGYIDGKPQTSVNVEIETEKPIVFEFGGIGLSTEDFIDDDS